ncbi:uncharacterized protein nfam1 isoform X1 [Epinephelus lanceolatus]
MFIFSDGTNTNERNKRSDQTQTGSMSTSQERVSRCAHTSVSSNGKRIELSLKGRVFVAFVGEHLNISCELKIPANHTSDVLMCSDPKGNEIYRCEIHESDQPQNLNLILEPKNLSLSGEYSCRYGTENVYWFLRVRREGYSEIQDYTQFYIVAIITGLLLVVSVVGSVIVFRERGKEPITEGGDTVRKRKQNREKMKESETEEDNVNAITSSSNSFYASLETRPRSIYDVLDLSAANRMPGQSKAKPKIKEPKETMAQSTQDQQEGVFESVYENF